RAAAAGSLYKLAGKSGTAQVFSVAITERVRKAGALTEHLRDHALFVAFAPVEAPRIAVAVVIENAPGGGSAFAAPIARRILASYLLTPEELAAHATHADRNGAAAAGAAHRRSAVHRAVPDRQRGVDRALQRFGPQLRHVGS